MAEAIWVTAADLWKRSNQGPDPAMLESLFFGARTTQYGALVALIICLYDYTLTIGDEVELFWANMDSKLTRVLYLLSRYLPLLALTSAVFRNNPVSHIVFSDTFCKANIIVMALCLTVQNITSTVVFGLRLYTLYYDQKLFRRAMVVVFSLGMTIIFVLMVLVFRTTAEHGRWFGLLGACISSPSKADQGVLVTSVVLETALAAATLWYAVTTAHYSRDLLDSIVNIFNNIYLQGGPYFFVIVTCRIINTFMLWLAPGSRSLLTVYLDYALASVMTIRWILNLREITNQTTLTKSTGTQSSPHSPSLELQQLDTSSRLTV